MVNVIFSLTLLLSAFASILFFREIKSQSEKQDYKPGLMQIISRCIAVAVLILSVLDIFKIADFKTAQSAFVFMGIVNAAEWIICEIHKRHPFKFLGFASKVLLVTSVLELTIFNMPFYHLWGGNYKETELNISDGIIESGGNFVNDSIVVSENSELVLTFKNLNMPVGTLRTEVSVPEQTKEARLYLDVKDDTNQYDYRYGIASGRVVNGRENSQVISCDFSGNVVDMRVKLTPQNGGTVTLNKVYVNTGIPMSISWVRFIFLNLIAVFIYTVMKEKFMQKSFAENKNLCSLASIVVTVVCCLTVFLTIDYKLSGTWIDEFKQQTGNQMTQEIVDAFENGQVELLEQPDQQLQTLNNPYDRSERDSSGIYYPWDHVYYNNNYYSYYGIAPVVLLFLPYHLITGFYFPDTAAVLIFSVIGIIGLTFLFRSFVKKWFSDISTGVFILCLVLLQTVSGVWFSVGSISFYETAISAGFAFLSWGTYFMFESNIIGRDEISLPKIAIASLLSAAAVLCRPTLVLYCICMAIFIIMAFKKSEPDQTKPLFCKKRIIYICTALLPMICLGLVQMWYNYARFGSPFDFGIQYSLTINDFTVSQFHPEFVFTAWFNYLFNVPVFTSEYPFIHTEFQDLGINGFFYSDYLATSITSGLFFIALPMFAYVLAGKAMHSLPDRQTKVKSLAYIGIPCVLIPVIIIASVWESGYAVRYMLDYSWEAVLGALAIIFFLGRNAKTEFTKKFIKIFLCFSVVWALLVSGIQSLNQAFRYSEYHYEYPEIAYSIEQIFAFWK